MRGDDHGVFALDGAVNRICPGNQCMTCVKFEQHVQAVESLTVLQVMRRGLISTSKPPRGSLVEEWSSWIANKVVFTATFFLVCNALPFVAVVWQNDMVFKIVNWISSNWWQLALLPLMGLAGKRSEKVNDFRDERQYRILLIGERLDEIRGN